VIGFVSVASDLSPRLLTLTTVGRQYWPVCRWLYCNDYSRHTTSFPLERLLNKWSRSFDERTYRLRICHPRRGCVHFKAALWPWRAVPCGRVCSPVMLQRLLLKQSMHFNGGEQPPPPKLSLSCGFRSPLDTWFLGPTRVYNANGFSVGSVVFVRSRL